MCYWQATQVGLLSSHDHVCSCLSSVLGGTGPKFSAVLPDSNIDFSVEAPSRFVRRHLCDMVHIMNWIGKNKMTLNLLKTVEIVFHTPNVSYDLLPPVIPRVSWVSKLLGVYLRHELNFLQQVESVVVTGYPRLYLLAQLKYKVLAYLHLTLYFKLSFLIKVLRQFTLDTWLRVRDSEPQWHMLQRVLP